MIETAKALKFLDYFSLVTVANDKVPNFAWKKYQTEKILKEDFIRYYEYRGGWKKPNSDILIPATEAFGIITGFDFLEVIDVDLKVFSTKQEQLDFWGEYFTMLQDNILDFDDKFCIYKTKNAGFHILYKSKRVEGNQKLAKLKGHKEAVIETRGIAGYVFAYPDNQVSKKSYFDIDFISDNDRDIIMHVSKMYNHIDEQQIVPQPKKDKAIYKDGETTSWDDYNQKTDIFEVIGNDFTIPRNGVKNKWTLIKRHGSTSPHSGYVFKDSGCMFLFTTATIYPHEKLITPFVAYAYRNHGGNLSDAAKELYQLGYGSRIEKVVKEIQKEIPKNIEEKEVYQLNKNDLNFPIDIFHEDIQSYILECNKTLDSNIDYLGSSLLWLISVCIGNSIEVEVKKGWIENATVWLSIVGKAGIGKTPSISNILFPLQKINAREIKDFIKKKEQWDFYEALSKKDKEQYSEPEKPVKRQFIANDITLEALVDLHQESDNAVGVFKDELAGWLKDMNKYRAGSDLEFWLSCWSGKSVNMNRKTARSSFVEKPFIPVLGGIQPSIFDTFYTDENKENGFMDRMLLSFPDASVDFYNDNEMDETILKWYKETIIMLYDRLKKSIKRDSEGIIISKKAVLSVDAKVEWKRIFNEITTYQNDDNENEYLKSMYPKQKSYIPRFALIIHVFNSFLVGAKDYELFLISKDSILKAEKLSKYFIAMAKKIKINSVEVSNIKKTAKDGKSNFEKLKLIFEENPEFNRSKTAELLGVSRQQINNLLKRIKEV
jgi:hypothetical protein